MDACSGNSREDLKLSPVAALQVPPMKEMKAKTELQMTGRRTKRILQQSQILIFQTNNLKNM